MKLRINQPSFSIIVSATGLNFVIHSSNENENWPQFTRCKWKSLPNWLTINFEIIFSDRNGFWYQSSFEWIIFCFDLLNILFYLTLSLLCTGHIIQGYYKTSCPQVNWNVAKHFLLHYKWYFNIYYLCI